MLIGDAWSSDDGNVVAPPGVLKFSSSPGALKREPIAKVVMSPSVLKREPIGKLVMSPGALKREPIAKVVVSRGALKLQGALTVEAMGLYLKCAWWIFQ